VAGQNCVLLETTWSRFN